MPIIAICLCQTDAHEGFDQIIYTSQIATFEYENTAQDFCKDKPHIALIDIDVGKLIRAGSVVVKVNE